MTTPALSIPIKVVGLDGFKQNMAEMNVTAANVARTVTAATIQMSAGFLASQGAAGAATLTFGKLLGFLRPITLGVAAVVDTFEFLKKSVELAGQQIEAFNAIADKSKSAGVSTDFWQRFTKSAPAAVLSIDQITAALENFNKAATERLGGSDIQARINELTKAGNFQGNSGVSQFAGSSTMETRLRAIVSLIDQAMQKGQRLAALDIASKAFGEPVAAALRADNGYLDQMLQKADAMSKSEIVSQDDIGRAIQLRDRINEAQKILADKWKPIESDMAQLGINARDNWASVVTIFADLVGLADKLYGLLKEIPDAFAAIGSSSVWTQLTELTGKLGLNSDPASLGVKTGIDVKRLDATNRLRAELLNPANVQRAMQDTANSQSAARGDTSKDPTPKQKVERDPFDIAINGVDKRIAALKAETATIAESTAARERAKTVASLEEAAKVANTKAGMANTAVTDQQRAAIEKEADAMMRATAASEKAKVAESIKSSRDTSLLSPEDVQIANQLKTIYPNVADALNSVEASAMRTNDALKSVSGALTGSLTTGLTDIFDGTKSVSSGFADMSRVVVRAIEEMIVKMMIVAPIMRTLQASMGGMFGGSAAGLVAGGMTPMADGGLISGPGTGRSDSIPIAASNGEFIVNAASTAKHHALLQSINSGSLRGFADGGLVSNVPNLPASTMIGGSVTHISPSIAVTVQGSPGQSPQDHARMGAEVAKAAGAHIQALIGNELRTQMRPGGILRK